MPVCLLSFCARSFFEQITDVLNVSSALYWIISYFYVRSKSNEFSFCVVFRPWSSVYFVGKFMRAIWCGSLSRLLVFSWDCGKRFVFWGRNRRPIPISSSSIIIYLFDQDTWKFWFFNWNGFDTKTNYLMQIVEIELDFASISLFFIQTSRWRILW